jgi:hypothetical protein
MNNTDATTIFRLVNKFVLINENVDALTFTDRLIREVKVSKSAPALFVLHKYLSERFSTEITEAVFAKLVELKHIPNHDYSTYEGFLRAFAEEMSSGASFGGAFSGAGDNATINATGMAGVDKPLSNKKRKIDKILSRTL